VRLGLLTLALLGLGLGTTLAFGKGDRPHRGESYIVRPLVASGDVRAPHRDPLLVNAWGLAASPTGPWWTANEARESSTLYSGAGRKVLLSVSVPGGPTGIVYNGGTGFRVTVGRATDPARFIYACEDGMLRAWTPTVPNGWSTTSVVVVDEAKEAAVFRGLAIAGGRIYAADFHNARIDVYDDQWRRVERPGAFVDRSIPSWYAPFGIHAIAGHVFVTYAWRAPVNGNDAPTGGYVDEFDLDGNLVARIGRGAGLNEPWGIALAPKSFGRFGGHLLVANFGDGRIKAFSRSGRRWQFAGVLRMTNGQPLVINGIWAIAFGNGHMAGPAGTLFFASGPHEWHGVTQSGVSGLLGSIEPAR
jgi:uncharacterized protein (TIGR03118 family)